VSLIAQVIRLAVPADPGFGVTEAVAVVGWVSSAPGLDEGGVQGHGLSLDDAALYELLQESPHDLFKPLRAHAVSESGEL